MFAVIVVGFGMAGLFIIPVLLGSLPKIIRELLFRLFPGCFILALPTILNFIKICSPVYDPNPDPNILTSFENGLMTVVSIFRWFGVPLIILAIWRFISDTSKEKKNDEEKA